MRRIDGRSTCKRRGLDWGLCVSWFPLTKFKVVDWWSLTNKVGAARPNLLLDSLIYFQTFKNGGIKIQLFIQLSRHQKAESLKLRPVEGITSDIIRWKLSDRPLGLNFYRPGNTTIVSLNQGFASVGNGRGLGTAERKSRDITVFSRMGRF
jgi:hypothetical protein